jgi:site-specific recombinase XerC
MAGRVDTPRTKSRSARTVRDIWLSAARTVFAWAVRKRRVPANPFEGCTVEVPRSNQTRETEKEFTEAEAQTILRASDGMTRVSQNAPGLQRRSFAKYKVPGRP